VLNVKNKTLRPSGVTETGDGDDSGSSTPSEEYKTPTYEAVPLPGTTMFEFPAPSTARELQRSSSPNLPYSNFQPISLVKKYPAELQHVTLGSAVTGLSPKSANPVCVQECTRPLSTVRAPPNSVSKDFAISDTVLPQTSQQLRMCNSDSGTRVFNSTPVTLLSNASVGGKVAGKKTASFAPLPNQTTWMRERVLRSASDRDIADHLTGTEQIPSSQLGDIRLRLEERRRQIENEKRRAAAQRTRQRQIVGGDAFVQVAGKNRAVLGSSTNEGSLVVDLSDSGVELERNAVESASAPFFPVTMQRTAPSVRTSAQGIVTCTSGTNGRHSTVSNESSSKPSVCQSVTRSSTASAVSSSASANSGRDRVQAAAVTGNKERASTVTSSSSKERVGDYGTSLDRLNSSLMELQGEIMRLSLQQDQIKSLVGQDNDPLLSTSMSSAANDQFYLSSAHENHGVGKLLGTTSVASATAADPGFVHYQQYAGSMVMPQQTGTVEVPYRPIPSTYAPISYGLTQHGRLESLFKQANEPSRVSVTTTSHATSVYTSGSVISSDCSSPTPSSTICSPVTPSSLPSQTVHNIEILNEIESLNVAPPVSVPSTAGNAAFFMTFEDNVTPRRPKPLLGAARNSRNSKVLSEGTNNSEPLDHASMTKPLNTTLTQHSQPPAVTTAMPAVGFLIVDDETTETVVQEAYVNVRI